jgi:predicted nucleic acid-binding protein
VIVVDSNVLAARNLAGVPTRIAERVEEQDPLWIVPPLWRYEFQNILTKAIWARLITPEDALVAWRKASAQMVENEHEPSPERVIELSGRYRITAYDANFIGLAMEMGVMCITEDGELHEKFPGIAVSMESFVKLGQTRGKVRETRATYRVRRGKIP